MGQNINYNPNDPSLKDLLDFFARDIKLSMNCHHIGTIESFDSLTQTATASINYVKTFLQIGSPEASQGGQQSVGDTSITNKEYPVLVSCPVICLGGGSGALTFPIQEGDECLVLFNDRDMDNWFAGSNNAAPATTRLHSYSDAIILVGLRSMSNVILDYDTDAVALRMGENSLKIYDDEIQLQIGADGETTLVQINADMIKATRGDGSVEVTDTFIGAYIGENTSIQIDADSLLATLDTTTFEVTKTGKLEITNTTGEFVSALNQLFTDIQNATVTTMLGPQPLIMPTFPTDLATFQSFKA